jgi:hypothetical protein
MNPALAAEGRFPFEAALFPQAVKPCPDTKHELFRWLWTGALTQNKVESCVTSAAVIGIKRAPGNTRFHSNDDRAGSSLLARLLPGWIGGLCFPDAREWGRANLRVQEDA